MALRPVDKLLATYLGFVSIVILARGNVLLPANMGMLVAHVLFGTLLFLFAKLEEGDSVGKIIHDAYPLLFILPLYMEFGLFNDQLGLDYILENDRQVQWMEDLLFGGQVSFTLIRDFPSVSLSWLLHLAYLAYYPIILVGPIWLFLRRENERARSIVFTTTVAFVICYVFFVLYPVAGPNYAFEHPTGPVRDVLPARLVYSALSIGSSVGAAFPSSHVAASLAATVALLNNWKPLGRAFVIPCLLLIVGTVYCQMHYGVDAMAGIFAGFAAAWIGIRLDGLATDRA